MASVSIAARESLRVSTVSLLSSQERSSAVRNVHLPPMRTRLTPRVAYSSCRRSSAARTSTPCGSRARQRSFRRAARPRRTASPPAAEALPAVPAIAARSLALPAQCRHVTGRSTGITTFKLGIAAASSILARLGRTPPAARIGHPIGSRLTLAHVDRRECALLVHLHQPFAHQFERRREARREHRRRERRLDHVGDQVFVEPRPIGRLADQPLERFARLGQRPDRALGEPHMRERAALALLRIGRRADRRASPSIAGA